MRPHMLLTPSQKRPARCLGFPRGQNLSPAPTTIAIDAAFLRLGTARGFLQARSYARARLNKIIREVLGHRFGTKLLDGLQKSLRLGSFCQNLRKDCKFYVSQSGIADYVSQEQYTAGAVSRFDRFHVEINSQQGERFIRSALQPASRGVCDAFLPLAP